MSIFKSKKKLLQYTCFGRIIRCTDRGFGFIKGQADDEWFHITDKHGKHIDSLEKHEGKDCLYIKGGAPFRYINNKPAWNSTIVRWQFADEIDSDITAANFEKLRNQAFLAADSKTLDKLLASDWYTKLWQKKANTAPKSVLHRDKLLDAAITRCLKELDDLEAVVHRLKSIMFSPWFCIDAEGQTGVFEQFFKPKTWPPKLFLTQKPFTSIPGYKDLGPTAAKAFATQVRYVNTIAIDLETDGKKIFQFGWKNAAGTGIKSDQTGLTDGDLCDGVKESLMGATRPTIVGHNLIKWDWAILTKNGVSYPGSARLWDTLVTSWLLEPWKGSHALIVAKNAHQADADAAACYSLFENQISRLSSLLGDQPPSTEKLIQQLINDPSHLALLSDRRYPQLPKKTRSNVNIISEAEARKLAWHSAARIELLSTKSRLRDPVLLPDICRKVAQESGELFAKLIFIIVTDARDHSVQVRLSNLPLWLIDGGLEKTLCDAHFNQAPPEGLTDESVFYIAQDLFQLDDKNIDLRVNQESASLSNPEEIALIWQQARRKQLSEQAVQYRFPGIKIRVAKRTLFSVMTSSKESAWLLFEPTGMKSKTPSWFLFPNLPRWMQLDPNSQSNKPIRSKLGVLPRWRDGDLEQLDVDRVFVFPDTANRRLYLADSMLCVLNLLKQRADGEILVLGMRWNEEAQTLQQNLKILELSYEHPGSALRQLEYLVKRGGQVLACAREQIASFVDAAKQLEVKIQIAVDELPLHEWHALLNCRQQTDMQDSQLGLLYEEGEVNQVSDQSGNPSYYNPGFQEVPLHGRNILPMLSRFLDSWLSGITRNQQCLILDARLTEARLAYTDLFNAKDIPFYTPEELLEDQKVAVFNEICHPELKDHDIPKDYDTYKNFLYEHWGFEDFRPGTQQPAIKSLLRSDEDMLIRLPTGAGKSVIFHLPALLRSYYTHRLTIVITPLRALMRDQAEGLWGKQFSEEVDYLSGGRDPWINKQVYQGVLDGRIKLVFIAPERFRVPRFVDILERRRRMDGGLEFIVFDEAHCISEWGFEFRPDYLHTAQYVAQQFKEEELPGNPHRLLLTSATVTQRNRTDLEKELGLGKKEKYTEIPENMPHPIQPYIRLESHELEEDDSAPSDEKREKLAKLLSALDFNKSAALIFVPRRGDCHQIAEWLNENALLEDSIMRDVRALPFHAGLPESVKEEAVELLKKKDINVLVCTKAFGMGMDIPHLHACVHYMPPAYIEDYLQEVGRIGRSESERKDSGHQLVTASLFYNIANINRNLGFVQDEAVKPPDLQDFFDYCLKQSIEIESSGMSLGIIPQKVRIDDKKKFSENKVTRSLFWLERMRVLRIEGLVRPDLELRVNLSKLKAFSSGSGLDARVAKCLFKMLDSSISLTEKATAKQSDSDSSERSPTPSLSRLVKGILKGFVALTSPSRPVVEPTQPRLSGTRLISRFAENEVTARVSIRELIAKSGMDNIDDLFVLLLGLHRSGAIFIEKTFHVSKPSFPSDDLIWELIELVIKEFLRSTSGRVEHLPKKPLENLLNQRYQDHLLAEVSEDELETDTATILKKFKRQISREIYRAINTATRILGFLRIEMRQQHSAETGEVIYIRAMPNAMSVQALKKAGDLLDLLKEFDSFVEGYAPEGSNNSGTFSFLLTDVLESFESDFRVRQLEQLSTLLERAGRYNFEGSLEEGGRLISIMRHEPLERHEPDSEKDDPVQIVYKDLLQKNELQELRALAMVLLTIMPPEDRKSFIDKYFDCMSAEEVTKLLEDTVGNVNEKVIASSLLFQNLLSQVRKERFSEEIERLNNSQLAICQTPFDVNILVNAGPGSGKTHVLMMRCAHLIHVQKVDPSEILVLAFNRAVVYEIRDRIRTLFRALGYGNYANKLDVSTFHSFALRHQRTTDQYQEEAIGEAVHLFAGQISSNQDFAKEVAGNYRAILIDEFQDMNEDFYKVVISLLENCKGGGMVIGDDDQDILTWNRKNWQKQYRKPCPLDATHYFADFRRRLEPVEFVLTVNYRSAQIIVEKSTKAIETVSSKIGFTRMKNEIQLSAHRSENGLVLDRPDLPSVIEAIKEALEDGDTVGILCRSNRECRHVFDQLMAAGLRSDEVKLLGAEDFPLYQLRHTGALLDICNTMNDFDFVENFIWEEIADQYSAMNLADGQPGRNYLNMLYELIREEVGRPRVRDIMAFVQDTRATDVQRLKAKAGMAEDEARLTLATVHKVKGLQFDTVVIFPSEESFPFQASNGQVTEPQVIDCAEEARLFYVAMTRARNRLYRGWGNREWSWYNRRGFSSADDSQRMFLKGSPGEIFVSWAGQSRQVETGIQNYIGSQVHLGDMLTLSGKNLFHEEQMVGMLSQKASHHFSGTHNGLSFRVSNVIRYTCGNYFREHNQNFWAPLHESVKRQSWFYVVLPEEGH